MPEDQGAPEDVNTATRGTVRSGMSFAAGSFVANVILGLVSAVVTARLFGIEVIGQYALVTAPWLLLIQLSSVSEQKALTRELATMPPKDPRSTALFVPVLVFSFLLTIVVAVPIVLLGAGALSGPVDQADLIWPSIALVVGYALLDNTSWNIDAALAAFIAGRELFWARLVQTAAFPVLAAAVRPVSASVWALTLATIASFVVGLVLRIVLVRRFLPLRTSRVDLRAGFHRLPSMLGFAVRLLPSRIAAGITQQAGIWILGATSSVRAVGSFARANSVAVRINDAGFRVSAILFPALVERFAAGDRVGFRQLLVDTQHLTAAPLLLGASVAGGVASGVLDVFGPGFDDAANAFAALLFAYAIYAIAVVQSQAFLAIGRPGAASWLATWRAIVSLALMIPLARMWSGTGVALALLAGMVQSWQLQGVLLRRSEFGTAVRTDLTFAVGAIASSLGGYAAARAVHLALVEPWATVLGAMAGTAAFVLIAIATGFIRPSDRARAVEVLRRRAGASTPELAAPRPDASRAPSP